MRKGILLSAAVLMAFAMCGCGESVTEAEVKEVPEQETAAAAEIQDMDYVFPAGVTLAENYENYDLQVPFGRIMDDWYDSEYQYMSLDSHVVYAAEEEGYDKGDQITISLGAANPSGILDMSICKKVTYIHNEQSGEWELSGEALKSWKREGKGDGRLNKTGWKRHYTDVSELDTRLFMKDGEMLIPELEAGKEGDFYIYFLDDFSFFNIKVDPNSGLSRETLFYTESSAEMYLIYEGETYHKHIHFVEGTVTDKGLMQFKPEDGDVYFELLPSMNLISDEEIQAVMQ